MKTTSILFNSKSILFLRLFLAFAGFSVFCLSCSDETESIRLNGIDGEEITIECSLSVPVSNISSTTRVQSEKEMTIEQLQIFVFEDSKYKYKASLSNIVKKGDVTTLSAKLRTSSSVVSIYALANADDAINNLALTVDMPESEMKTNMKLAFPSSGITEKLPMSGQFIFQEGLNMELAKIPVEIRLLRAVARVDIVVESGVNNFKLETIQAFRANNQIQVIPTDISNFRNPVVITPSIPSTSSQTTSTSQFMTTSDQFEAQMYISESVAPPLETYVEDATCIVVGGYYNGSNDLSYYRIDFNTGNNTQNLGRILRNHRYVFRLTSVSDKGYDEAIDAANNKASNMEITIQDWNEDTTYMVFDGENYFSVSTRSMELKSTAGSTAEIKINTDLPTYTINWSDQTNNADQTTSATEISNAYFEAKLTDDNGQAKLIVTALQDNTDTEPRQQFITIFAGNRWKILIEINQLKAKDYSKTYINILSIGTSYGSFGNNMLGSGNSDGTSNGIRPILNLKSNFGPNGIVPIGGILFGNHLSASNINGASMQESASFLRMFDIINLTYSINLSTEGADNIYNWLQDSPNRVLIVARDNGSTNTNVINKLMEQIMGQESVSMFNGDGTYGSSANAYIPDSNTDSDTDNNTGNDYFTRTGPFGAMQSPPGTATFRIYDSTWQGLLASSEYAKLYVTPLAIYDSKSITYYMIAVDKTHRIIYITDSNLYQSRDPGLIKSDGSVDYDQAKLIGNIFAWAINEIILPGK